MQEFQSTLPVRGATGERRAYVLGTLISIHAPREGSDSKLVQIKLSILDNIQ